MEFCYAVVVKEVEECQEVKEILLLEGYFLDYEDLWVTFYEKNTACPLFGFRSCFVEQFHIVRVFKVNV